MTATRRRPSDSIQPELPLCRLPTEHEPAGDEEWRLDERTREIGLRGVALARARLQRSETTRETGRRSGGRGPTGRAA
jgi:hypothetical protein